MDPANPSCSSSKADRKTIEKNRRNQMKALYFQLNSLIPHHQSPSRPREMVSLPDQLEGATNYIKNLQAKLEKMKQKKNYLMGGMSGSGSGSGKKHNLLPSIDVRITGSALQVALITALNGQFIFNGIIRLLYEQGADVVSATFSVVDTTVFHTIHATIDDQNHGGARVSEILTKFVYDCV